MKAKIIDINHSLFWRDLVTLFIVTAVFYFLWLGSRALGLPDEARYCEIPRELLCRHNWMIPYLNGVYYFEKPPLFYWLQIFGMKILGMNEWGGRFATAGMAVIGVSATFTVTYWLYGRRVAWMGSFILMTSLLYFVMGHYATIDMTVSVLMMGTLYAFMISITAITDGHNQKAFYSVYAIYIFAALAVLAKGLIGLLLPGVTMFLYFLVTNRWRFLREFYLFRGSIVFLIIALPWHLYMQQHFEFFFGKYILFEQVLRYFTPVAHRQGDWYFMSLTLLGWLVSLGVFFAGNFETMLSSYGRSSVVDCLYLVVLYVVVLYVISFTIGALCFAMYRTRYHADSVAFFTANRN